MKNVLEKLKNKKKRDNGKEQKARNFYQKRNS